MDEQVPEPTASGEPEVEAAGGDSPVADAPATDGDFAIEPDEPVEYESAEEETRSSEDELNALRIRQITTARRADVRARTYLFVGCFAAGVGSVNLALMTVERVRVEGHVDWRAAAYLLLAAACSMLARYFWRRAGDITRDLAKPLQVDPPTPPDFSALGDGTRVAKDLEDVR